MFHNGINIAVLAQTTMNVMLRQVQHHRSLKWD